MSVLLLVLTENGFVPVAAFHAPSALDKDIQLF
jgi:hypothetical protein